MSLRGLVRHMTEVETGWFRQVLGGEQVEWLYCSDDDPDGDFDGVGRDPVEPDLTTAVAGELQAFSTAVRASRALTAAHDSLDDTGAGRRRGELVSLRWILLHMIEEYARHNGHADLLRERIDGATGD